MSFGILHRGRNTAVISLFGCCNRHTRFAFPCCGQSSGTRCWVQLGCIEGLRCKQSICAVQAKLGNSMVLWAGGNFLRTVPPFNNTETVAANTSQACPLRPDGN